MISVNLYFRLPAIVCDNDGVIVKGRTVIGRAPHIVKQILEPYSAQNLQIPFILLTNGGGIPEGEKAEDLNRRLGLDALQNPEGRLKLTQDHMFLCHTPLSDPRIVEEFQDQYVLVSGFYDELRVAQHYGYQKAIHVEELTVVFPDEVPNDILIIPQERLLQHKQSLEKRFGKSVEDLGLDLNFAAIFIVYGTVFSTLTLQIFSDVIASRTGHPKGERIQSEDEQFVKVYSCNRDLVWPNTWPVPRYGPKICLIALQSIFKAYYGFEFKTIQYGKPEASTFEYTEQIMKQKAQNQGLEISNFYMIGDTPESDIQGANNKGWISILVRTGIHQSEENDKMYPAQYLVEDLEEAVRLIFRLENIDREI
eukprot:403361703